MKENIIEVFHGSEKVIQHPTYGMGTTANDYGRGFYCTENVELAKEWACKKGTDGFANCYELNTEGLRICNLNSDEYHILNWLALLTRYRSYWQKNSIAEEAKQFLQEHYCPDISCFDIIIGYRADDSYFSFARDFVMGTISLQKLSRAMQLGKHREQIVIRSELAFQKLLFTGFQEAPKDVNFSRKIKRDLDARRDYSVEKKNRNMLDEIYMIDIMRGKADPNEWNLR